MQNSGTAGHRGVKLNPWKDLELGAEGGSTTGIINPEKDLCSRILPTKALELGKQAHSSGMFRECHHLLLGSPELGLDT